MMRREDGFTLVEVLVAIAILTGAASTILFVFASNAARSAQSLDRLRAVFAADAILARVGLDIPLRPQHLTGRLRDGATWSVEIDRYAEPGFPPDAEIRLLVVDIEVTPAREESGAVHLKTLKRTGF